MRPSRTPILGLVAALAAAGAVAGGAVAGGSADDQALVAAKAQKHLWSTVNICDTNRHPDQLGIRARMPGNGTRQKMRMRFFVEYMKEGSWVPVKGAMSPWRVAGSADFTWQELGWTFKMTDLNPGDGFRMRGLVKFQWRRHGKIVRQAHAYTSAGHPTGTGDPANYSAATCFMSGGI
jgi:hypothetical protein